MPRSMPLSTRNYSNMSEINVTHITSSISRRAGGLFESVRHLSLSIMESRHVHLSVVGLSDSNTAADLGKWAPLQVNTYPVTGPERFGFAPGMWRDLRSRSIDILHLHGLWTFPSLLVGRWGVQTRRPYMVSPHGMLEPWSLQQSKFRKAVARFLYQDPCLRNAFCIRATSQLEAESIRAAGYRNMIALIPNGVEIPDRIPPPPVQKRRLRRILFMSRIHPKKGLLNLIEAWSRLNKEQRAVVEGWELHIVGPDEQGHKAEVVAAVRRAGLEPQIHFPGEAWGTERLSLYLESDVFVLPSFSENFGLVIAEALGCGIPVITTKATPWEDLVTHRCGWWIEVGVDPLVFALREAMSLPPQPMQEMGLRGRQLIEAKYTWSPIGRQMVETYEWMFGHRAKPDCIFA